MLPNRKVSWATLWVYQRQARGSSSGLLLGVLVFIFVSLLVERYRGFADPESATWSAMWTADAELIAAVHSDSWPAWVQWTSGVGSTQEALDALSSGFADLDRQNLLDQEGVKVAHSLAGLAKGEGTTRSHEEWQKIFQEQAWAWEVLEAKRQYRDNPPIWLVEELSYYEDLGREKAYTIAASSFVWWLVIICGLPFLPAALKCFRQCHHVKASPVMNAWRPGRVTVAYLIVEICFPILFGWFMSLIPSSAWYQHYWATSVITDTLWRVGGPLLLGGFIFVRWRHAWRLLGLHLRPILPPIFGMMALGGLYHFVLFGVMELFIESESLTSLSVDENGLSGLVFIFVSGVIMAPLFEEIVYRGILFQGYVKRFGFWSGLALSTSFFVLIHYYGVYGSLSVATFGIGACALFRATGSLWTAILFHSFSNAIIILTNWAIYYEHY